MDNSNTLMFKIGIADVKAELDKHKKEIDSWVNANPIKLKVQFEDSALDQLAAKLKAMGATFGESNAEVKKLQEELAALKAILNSMMNGAGAKQSPVTNELRVMTKGTESAITAMNQLSKLIDETESKSSKGFPVLDRLPAKYSKLVYDIENRMTAIGNIMAKEHLPSWLDNGQGRGYINNVLSDYEKLLKTMKSFQQNGFIDYHNLSAFRDVFRGLESAYGPILKQAAEYNNLVEKNIKTQERIDAKAIKEQAAEYKILKKNTQDARNEAENLVAARKKMLQDQASSLSKIMIQGRGKLDTFQYEQMRDALRAIREELRQIEIVKQRGGLSVQTLFGLGSGSQDFSGIISAYQRFISGKQQAASANTHLTSTEQQLANAIKNSTVDMKVQSQIMSDLKMMATQYLGVWGAQGFLRNIIEIGGQLEMQRLSIGAILGDMAKATELFDRIKNLAIKSPFGVVELDQMTKQLSAYGFEYNELFDMTKRLADISAATGTSVDRLALALGHVRSEAALSGYTLRQFSMANIPLAKKLSEELTKVEGKLVSVADIRKRVRSKDISYEQVLKVLKDLTDEGGMFYNAQEIMSESVKARFKNLKDSMDIMYGEIAESKVGGGLKEVATMLTTLTRHWQELGAVLIAGAGYLAINRVAIVAANKAMVQGNLMLGRFSAAQLETQAITGHLTREELLQAVASKKLAVADAEAAASVLGLSRAQLQHVANTGKVTSAMNMATIATSKYTISQLRMIATWRQFNFGWLATGFVGIATGAKAAAVAIGGMVKSLWPLLIISGVVEIFMNMKREAEQFADAANYVGQAARNMMKDIDDAVKSVTKNGKPVDTEALREAVNIMKEVLENSEFYTAEQQKQVDQATTLSKKYDILLKQMKEMKAEAEWQTNNEGLIAKILANTGRKVKENTAKNWNGQTGEYDIITSQTFGSRFFNDSLQENIEQVNKSNAALQSSINLLSEYQNVIEDAIKKNDNFGLSLDGKTWQEQVRLIAESGKWDEFVSSVENAGSRFEKTASNVKKASDKVRDDWQDIVNDDVKAIRLTLMQEWNMTEDEITQFAKNNERTMRWLVDAIAKSLSKLGVAEAIIDEFKQKLLELFGVANSGKPTKTEPTEYQKQTDLAKRILGNVIRHNKNNGKGGQGVTTVKEINDIVGTGEHVKTESEVIKALKEKAQNDLQSMNDIEKIYGKTSDKYAKAKKKYEHSLNLAESNGVTESEIRSGKYKDKNLKETPDEAAKAIREEMRIMKEAADAFQYWRKKVGDVSAWDYVEEEFGDVLERIGVTAKNVNDLRGNIEGLTPKIAKIKDKKVQNETYKEQSKELAQLNRKDFEKKSDEWASAMSRNIDELTRKWEIFNSVVSDTGDRMLAARISGISPGATPADLKRMNVRSAAGVGIDFESVLGMSDVQIEEYVYTLGIAENKIKAIQDGLKDWKKAQQDVTNDDIQNYAKWLGSLVDLESIRMRNQEEYNRILEETNRLLSQGVITQEEAERRRNAAATSRDTKNWQATSMYTSLYNNSQAMAEGEFYAAYNREMANLFDQMKAGTITMSDYADKVEKLNKIAAEFKMQGFLGIKGGAGAYLSGGYQGLIDYHWNKAREKRAQNDIEGAKKEEKTAESMMKAQRAAEQLAKTFNDLSSGADLVANMFDALGMEGAATAFGDAAGVLGGIGQGAQSLSAFGPWGMAAGGIIGGITSIAQLNDKNHERRIQELKREVTKIDNTLNTIKSLRERELGYDSGTLRSQLVSLYKAQERNISLFGSKMSLTPAQSGMVEYYGRYSGGNGYSQEYNALVETRKKYMEMYDEENAKKKKSQEALEEYKVKIAELDEEIMYFVQDLAKDLWSIDIQGWASQISDALWTAFENGEDAVKAFGETAKDIVSSVAKNMMTLSVIEPMFKQLQYALFGEWDSSLMRYKGNAIQYDSNGNIDMQASEEPVLKVLGRYFGEGGELEKTAEASETFYKWVEKITGMDLSSDESKSGASSSIKNITESTADLLASYLNAVRLDVSVVRAIQGEYFPLFLQAILASNTSLTNIENNTAAIMRSNDIIANKIKAIDDRFRGLENKTWKMPIA